MLIQCQKRNAAFLTILDFYQEHTKEMDSSMLIERTYEAVKSMINLASKHSYKIGINAVPNVSIYSNRILISYLEDIPHAAELLMRDCIYLYVTLLNHGILLGGIVATGELYHNKNVVFGPLFKHVDELLLSNQPYPRIIVDQPEWDNTRVAYMYKQDEDGANFIDILHHLHNIEVSNEFDMSSEWKDTIISNITTLYSNHSSSSESHRWLQQNINDIK